MFIYSLDILFKMTWFGYQELIKPSFGNQRLCVYTVYVCVLTLVAQPVSAQTRVPFKPMIPSLLLCVLSSKMSCLSTSSLHDE